VKLNLDADGGYTVAFETSVNTSIMAVLGFDKMDAKASSTARKGLSKKVEIALALDNTESMQDSGINALKVAANDFVTQVFSKSSKGQLKIGIVPFVGVVNPGLKYIDNADMADYDGQADYHGYYLAGQPVDGACDSGGATPSTAAPAPPAKGSLDDIFEGFGAKFSGITQELIGIKAAKAAPDGRNGGGTTGATDFNTIINWPQYPSRSKNDPTKPKEAKVLTPGSVRAPAINSPNNFTLSSDGCTLYNPLRVNHFDLFKRTGPGGIAWKGCVMARKDPYDMDDSAPTADANTKFVPFFWPSEPMSQTEGKVKNVWNNFGDKINDPASTYTNNYMSFIPYNNGGGAYTSSDDRSNTTYALGYFGEDPIASKGEILKYNGTDNNNNNNLNQGAPIQSNNDDNSVIPLNGKTWGPNKACPNEVTPLTDTEATLHTQINGLSRWDGGGTVASEGLMWAWRVLSPNKPYALGSPYSDLKDGKVQKYIILMTDGENNLNTAGPVITGSVIKSEQTAYGALWEGRTYAPQVLGLVNQLRDSSMPLYSPNVITTFNTGTPSGEDGANDFLNDRFTKTCENAKAKGIKVFTIYFKSAGAASLSAAGNDAKNYLTQCSIFSETDGGAKTPHFYYAENDAELKTTFKKIADSFSAGARLSK
jgi:hypothetical protein